MLLLLYARATARHLKGKKEKANGMWRDHLHTLPAHMRESITLWIDKGFPSPGLMGKFLHCLLTGDLFGAFRHADEENLQAMRQWVLFLENYAPADCYGSPAACGAWYAQKQREREAETNETPA